MKNIRFNLLIAIVLVVTSFQEKLFAETEYYKNHYVIVVDQGVIQRHPNTFLLYQDIKELFLKNTPLGRHCAEGAIPQFDEKRDQISIFASGISEQDYLDLFWGCRNSRYNKSEIADKISNKLFHVIGDFQTTNKTLSTFLIDYLKPVMNGSWKQNHLQDCRVGLNEYLYPLVLYKLDANIPSENYYFIIVSNFTAQGAIHTVLRQQVEPMLGRNEYISEFESDIERWRSYFYENDFAMGYTTRYANNEGSTTAEINNNPKINYFKLGVKSLESVGISIKSSPQYTQKKLHGEEYNSTGTDIVFNHPQNLKIKNVWADIQTDDANVLIEYKLEKNVLAKHEGDLQIYQFEDQKNIKLGELHPADKVETRYHFSTLIEKTDGSPLLPMIFSTGCSYEMRENDFVPVPDPIPLWAKILIILVIASSVITPLYYIWRRRGKNVNAVLENVRFVPVSRERYMDVSNMKVKEYDCWYMDPESQQGTKVKLEVKGVLKTTKRLFAKDMYRVRLEFKIEDIDFDDNFTFRPKGKDDLGNEYQVGNWYLAEVEDNGEFTIPIIAYLDTDKHPELLQLTDGFWMEDHILKTQIDFRAFPVRKHDETTLKAKKLDSNLSSSEIWPTHPIQIYEFIARPTFTLRDSWIAFDPGTTGACAAFITGGNIDTLNNIHMVYDPVSSYFTDKDIYEPVFPSKIVITDDAQSFHSLHSGEEIADVHTWEEGADEKEHKDFLFGWKAEQLIKPNSFQSIKKLLGYTNTQSIINKEGKELQISGKLLAQLLVKGMYAHTQRYIMDLYRNSEKFNGRVPHPADPVDIENQYLDNGHFTPKKAIVAVPNNYTLPKIQDMVDTVKALGQFKEVHYLYESEGILMEYCHRNWQKLDTKEGKLIIVFDMGGATINATAFKLTKTTKDQHNNITDIVLKTVGKIGYCVGGDDIDYAIIRQIYAISFIKELYKKDEGLVKQHMANHKQLLIKLARELKLAIIAKHQGMSGSILDTPEGFHNHLLSYAKDMGWPEESVNFTPNDDKVWMNPNVLCQKSKILQNLVYSKITDSVQELFASMAAEYRNLPVEIIFGGRSTLFPYVQETVKNAIPQGHDISIWKGLEKDGVLDANAVKTAVATGACWYANFSQHITIEHNIITTAFGYLDHKQGKEIFVPMIQAGEKFKNGMLQKETEPYASTLLQQVVFVQMQGANHEKILNDFRSSNEQKHKMNILDKVKPESDVTKICITLDERFNFDYEISTASGVEEITSKNYPASRLRLGAGVRTEIADENNESYMFAAISSHEEIKAQQNTIKEASTSNKVNKRF